MAPDVGGDFATGFVIFQALIIHETKDILFASVSFVPTFLFHSFQVFESSGVRTNNPCSVRERIPARSKRDQNRFHSNIYFCYVLEFVAVSTIWFGDGLSR